METKEQTWQKVMDEETKANFLKYGKWHDISIFGYADKVQMGGEIILPQDKQKHSLVYDRLTKEMFILV